jgi:hypothetical protein
MKFMEVMSMQCQLRSLLAESQAPAVSIFVPTHRASQEIRQDPIRLKNLVRQAEQQLINEGARPAEARNLLEPVAALVEDAAFWRHQAEGLAVFRSPDVFRSYRVSFPLSEFVAVSDRFYIKPLLPLLINEARFYVLALSQKTVRLLDCTRDGVEPIPISNVPQDIEQTLPERPEAHLQRHSLPMGGPDNGQFHAHGVGTEEADMINVKRYFQLAEDGLRQRLTNERAPLILACVEYLAPIYREVSTYRFILEEIVAGNPDGVPDAELHRKARPIADRQFEQARAKAIAEYHEGIAKGRASHTLPGVLTAAFQGRIATLFIPLGMRQWGRFDFNRLILEEHDHEEPGDEELLDLAAAQTLRYMA